MHLVHINLLSPALKRNSVNKKSLSQILKKKPAGKAAADGKCILLVRCSYK